MRTFRHIPGAKFYHVYTKGIESSIIFKDREDYIVGMNYIPIYIMRYKLQLLAFVLMTNHFHFVVYCMEAEAWNFIDSYRMVLSKYLSRKYGGHKFMKNHERTCKEINLEFEGLKKTIAYVLNNPVKAGYGFSFQNYEWGSAKCYFPSADPLADTRSLSELGTREAYRMLKTKTKIDKLLRINARGYIEPYSYICVGYVETLFKRYSSLEYFVTSSKSRQKSKEEVPFGFSDELLLRVLNEIIYKRYDGIRIDEMSIAIKGEIITILKKQFNCNSKQIARLMGLTISEVVNIIAVSR